jgi:hypothetical protein
LFRLTSRGLFRLGKPYANRFQLDLNFPINHRLTVGAILGVTLEVFPRRHHNWGYMVGEIFNRYPLTAKGKTYGA